MSVVVAVAVAAGAAAQAVTGIGFSLVSAPFLVSVHGRDGIRTVVLLSAVLNAAMVARERRDVRLAMTTRLLVPAALATPALALVVRRAPERGLAVAAGLAIVVAVLLLASGLRLHRARGRGGAVAAGVVSAGMNVVAGVGGPPVALYAVNAGWPPRAARASLQAYFLCLNVVALVGLGLPPVRWWLFAAMAAGWVVGYAADRVVPDRVATTGLLVVAGTGGAATALRAALTTVPNP